MYEKFYILCFRIVIFVHFLSVFNTDPAERAHSLGNWDALCTYQQCSPAQLPSNISMPSSLLLGILPFGQPEDGRNHELGTATESDIF